MHQDKFKENIRDNPEILALIKTFKVHQDPNLWEPKHFTMDELKKFVSLNINDKFWLLRKAISIIAYFTQLSYKSLKNLKMQDLQTSTSSSDIYVQTTNGKVQILHPEFTSIVTKYYETVINDSKQPM